MPKSVKMKNAWLLTWTILRPKENNGQIAAILSSRKSDNHVAEVVELLYLRSTRNAADMAYYANRRTELPVKAQNNGGKILCGTSPHWLYARIVSDLRIQVDEENGKEILTWTEPPSYKFKDYEIDEIIEGEKKSFERKYFSPLSKDVYPNL